MAREERYIQIRLNEREIAALNERAKINLRAMAAEGAMIIKAVLAGKGEPVTVPGVNELNFLGATSDEVARGQDGEDAARGGAAGQDAGGN